jgi:hypothetical protein
MFRGNDDHIQSDLFGFEMSFDEQKSKSFRETAEYIFYENIFCNIREEDFSVLYDEEHGRPNAPVNCMVAALLLMTANEWTYEELKNNIDFNLLTRKAIGLQDINETPFALSTLFYFQNKIQDSYVASGINLLEKVFDYLTEDQKKALHIKTDIQRMDSFMVMTNIRNYSRLQLIIEGIIRFYRILNKADGKEFVEKYGEYVKQSSGQYVYRLKKKDVSHEIEKIGVLYSKMIESYGKKYSETFEFSILTRIFSEHFRTNGEKIELIPNEEIKGGTLQSPDDVDATYRNKNGQKSKGYSICAVETANPDNQLNLIMDVNVRPNNVDDSEMLNERLEIIKEKTPDLNEAHTDGGFGSAANDILMEKLGINHIQTAIKGCGTYDVIEIKKRTNGKDYFVQCPYQKQKAAIAREKYKVTFDNSLCMNCDLKNNCPTMIQKDGRGYYFNHEDYLRLKRINNIKKLPKKRRSLRPNAEATMMEFENKLTDGKLKTRGYFKALVFAYTSAIMINFGRFYRYMMNKYKKEGVLMSKIDFLLKFYEIIINFIENLFISKKFRAAFNI